MAQRSLIVLAAAAVVVVAAAGIALNRRDSGQGTVALPAALYPGLIDKLNGVKTLSVAGPEESFTIVKADDGKWSMPAKGGYPVTVETVKQALVNLAELKPIEAKTSNPELLPKLDLQDRGAKDAKAIEVKLVDAQGKDLVDLLVGKRGASVTSAQPGTLYVRKAGDNQAWLVSSRLELEGKSVRWLDRDVVKVERKRVHQVVAQRPDGAKFVVARDKPEDDDFKVKNLPEGAKEKSSGAPNALGSALGYMSYEDVAPVGGVDFSNAPTAEYRTFDGLVVTVWVAEKDGKHWIKLAAAQDSTVTPPPAKEGDKDKPKTAEEVAKEAAEYNAKVKDWAYEVTKYKAEDFTKSLDDVIDKDKKQGS